MATVMTEKELRLRLNALRAKYPYQFEGPNIGIEMEAGWMGIFERLCADIDTELKASQADHPFHWIQVKEKYGTIRTYYSAQSPRIDIQSLGDGSIISARLGGDASADSLWKSIDKLVEDAEEETAKTCQWCGAPGRLREQGWLVTLCDEHEHSTYEDLWPPHAGDKDGEIV